MVKSKSQFSAAQRDKLNLSPHTQWARNVLLSLESKLPRVERFYHTPIDLRFSSVDAVCEYQRANRSATA